MSANSKIALSVALVLATASAAAAAAKHAVHHQTATERQPNAATYLGAGSARSSDSVNSVNPCYSYCVTSGSALYNSDSWRSSMDILVDVWRQRRSAVGA
jgi:hypothetical protein